MADSAFNPGVQPKFPRMAQLQRDLAEEDERISNIPQFTTDNAILEAFNQVERRLGERIDALTQQVRQSEERLGGRIDQLSQQQQIR
jgi:hypothetical protein